MKKKLLILSTLFLAVFITAAATIPSFNNGDLRNIYLALTNQAPAETPAFQNNDLRQIYLAITGGGGGGGIFQDLQSVTDQGNVTNNSIKVDSLINISQRDEVRNLFIDDNADSLYKAGFYVVDFGISSLDSIRGTSGAFRYNFNFGALNGQRLDTGINNVFIGGGNFGQLRSLNGKFANFNQVVGINNGTGLRFSNHFAGIGRDLVKDSDSIEFTSVVSAYSGLRRLKTGGYNSGIGANCGIGTIFYGFENGNYNTFLGSNSFDGNDVGFQNGNSNVLVGSRVNYFNYFNLKANSTLDSSIVISDGDGNAILTRDEKSNFDLWNTAKQKTFSIDSNNVFQFFGNSKDANGNVLTNGQTLVSDGTKMIATTVSETISQTSNLDFGSISDGASAQFSVTVAGAAAGDVAIVNAASGFYSSDLILQAYASAANTVVIKASNYTGAAVDPAAFDFYIKVLK